MALRGVLDHPKTWLCAEMLKIPRCFVVGVLESLWHTTAAYAPTGAIGRMSNAYLAHQIGYTGCSEALFDALRDAGFLDEHPVHRLIVHDWHVHSDNTLDAKLYRTGERYANGTMPRGTKIGAAEKAQLFERYYQQTPKDLFTVQAMPVPAPTASAPALIQQQETMRATGTDGAFYRSPPGDVLPFVPAPDGAAKRLPEPEPEPEPVPEPDPVKATPTPFRGGLSPDEDRRFSNLRDGLKRHLRDDIPIGLQVHRFTTLRTGGDDYLDCFDSMVLVRRSRPISGEVFCLESDDTQMTRAGCEKYARTLERLACQCWGFPKGTKVKFVVRERAT